MPACSYCGNNVAPDADACPKCGGKESVYETPVSALTGVSYTLSFPPHLGQASASGATLFPQYEQAGILTILQQASTLT